MNNYIYNKVDSIVVKNNNNEFEFKSVSCFDEYDHEIVVESAMKIDGLNRGFIGDLIYMAKGFNARDINKEVTTTSCYRDVFLARITMSAQPGCPVVWKYDFLKD